MLSRCVISRSPYDGRLTLAAQADMEAQSIDSTDRQRPFKIFISLLDKWEIGAALSEVLVLDAFAALQTSLRPNDDHDEVRPTILPAGYKRLLSSM